MRRGILFFFLFLVSCVGPAPKEEYVLAYVAKRAAQKAGALSLAPGSWAKAEEFYFQAERFFRQREYAKAREFFRKARYYAEKAENLARVKKMKMGEEGF